MQKIATIRNQDIISGSPLQDPANYPYRETARAVIFDGSRVALVYIADEQFYKLPGGGIEQGESVLEALHREVLEEIGYHIHNIQEIGETLEYKDSKPEKQRSCCFTAHITGNPMPIQLTDDEKAIGLTIAWADSLEQAISLVESASPKSISARFIQRREALVLRAAQKKLNS